MRALDRGPAHLPHGLFAGSHDRVLAGMTVHANTISHARLMALEDTFPRTRHAIGVAMFNAISRLFLEQPGVTARPLARIGAGFDDFLSCRSDHPGAADLARFEWCWLQSYHAADAPPLELATLVKLAPDVLLDQELMRHPAATASRFGRHVGNWLSEEVNGLEHAEAILIARPGADVLVSPATAVMVRLLAHAEKAVSIGNLLAPISETRDNGEAPGMPTMQALITLINAGAFTAA